MKRKHPLPVLLLALIPFLPACSIQKMAFNSVADMFAPSPHARKAPSQNTMIALTGENDPELVRDFFPTALKMYEIMLSQNPRHEGLALMTGQLYIMYANAFVQGPAEQLPMEQFSTQNAAYFRAKNFYLRGADYILTSLGTRYRDFPSRIFESGSAEAALLPCRKNDAGALYWAGAGLLGAFSLDPMDVSVLDRTGGALAMLEKAAELDPGYNNGAIWEVLMAFYAASPESMGGGADKAAMAFEQALRWSEGKSPSTWIGYARTFCIPAQDSAGFDEAIEKALAIDPESQPENRLALVLARRQALYLKANKANFILE